MSTVVSWFLVIEQVKVESPRLRNGSFESSSTLAKQEERERRLSTSRSQDRKSDTVSITVILTSKIGEFWLKVNIYRVNKELRLVRINHRLVRNGH